MKPTASLPPRVGRPGPLSGGLRVLDLSACIAGPHGCSLLADQGAEGIEIEPPDGDDLRRCPSTLDAESRAFFRVDRGKLGVVPDFEQPGDQAALRAPVRGADVLVHDFRPSVPKRLGIACEQPKAENPRPICGAVAGYGETGPLPDKAGCDPVPQTLTGMCAMQGRCGQPPELRYGSVVDDHAAALVAAGVASALYEREKSGEGRYVGVSLLRSALAMQSARLVRAEGEPREVVRDMRSGGIAGIHPTKDGRLYISADTPRFRRALCEKTGLAGLADDERHDSVRERALHEAEIVQRLHAALAARSALDWEALFAEELPCAAARTVEDMFDDPQVEAEALLAVFAHPTLGAYRGFTRPIVHSRTPGPEPFAAPLLGQHTARALGVLDADPDAAG